MKLLNVRAEDVISRYEDSFEGLSKSKKEIFSNLLNDFSYCDGFKYYAEQKCGALKRFKDRRTGVQYAVDLILGWLSEDTLLHFLKQLDKNAILAGKDRFREFLSPIEISTQADIIIITSCGQRKLELINDWSDTWIKSNHLDLRENKYLSLKNEGALLLGISPNIQKGLLLDLKDDDKNWHRVGSHFPFGGKPCWQHSNPRDLLSPLNDLMKVLISI